MIVERDGVDPAVGEPFDDLGLGIEIVGLVAKVVAGIGPEPGPQPLDAIEDGARILRSAQPASHDQVTP